MHTLGRMILPSLLTGTLTSCTTLYAHPTKTVQEWYADTSTCQALAGQAGGIFDTYGIVRAKVHKECLYGKGWAPVRP